MPLEITCCLVTITDGVNGYVLLGNVSPLACFCSGINILRTLGIFGVVIRKFHEMLFFFLSRKWLEDILVYALCFPESNQMKMLFEDGVVYAFFLLY